MHGKACLMTFTSDGRGNTKPNRTRTMTKYRPACSCITNQYFMLQFNFVGRILGPRGMTAKQLEQDTGCKILVRGKGSMRDKTKVRSLFIMKQIGKIKKFYWQLKWLCFPTWKVELSWIYCCSSLNTFVNVFSSN